MKPYKAIHIEDNKVAVQLLAALLKPYKDIVAVHSVAINIKEAANILAQEPFDITFLDIDLAGSNAFDLLNDLPENRFGKIICCSANGKLFINKMFENKVIYYLEKPFVPEKIDEMVRIIIKEFSNHIAPLNTVEVLKGIANKRAIVNHKDIFYIEADAKKSIYHFFDGPNNPTFGYRLGGFREQLLLLSKKFVQCHKSFIVNLDYSKEFTKQKDELVIEMPDKFIVKVSRYYMDHFMNAIKSNY